MQDLIYLAIFKRIAEKRHFTLVAHELGMTPSAVSRQITRLEENLGVQLLVRTTRHIRLTEAGQVFYEKCARSLAELEEASHFISQQSKEPQGSLSISATPCFGKLHVASAIPDFLQLYPKARVDISLTYSEASFAESSVDILIRGATVPGRNITFQNLASMRHIICATPEYLKQHGTPKTPADLKDHNCLILTRPHPIHEWRFNGPHRSQRVRVAGNLRTNSMEALHSAAVQGLGIARLPNYVCGPELRNGRLVSVFPRPSKTNKQREAVSISTNTMKAHYVRSRFPNPVTLAFIDFLKVRFKDNYDWERRPDSI
jgi:DNA-binding transcriptional LysR family regulator